MYLRASRQTSADGDKPNSIDEQINTRKPLKERLYPKIKLPIKLFWCRRGGRLQQLMHLFGLILTQSRNNRVSGSIWWKATLWLCQRTVYSRFKIIRPSMSCKSRLHMIWNILLQRNLPRFNCHFVEIKVQTEATQLTVVLRSKFTRKWC